MPLVLEALVGPDVVADALVAAVEQAAENHWAERDQDRAGMVKQLGFILLRVRPDRCSALRARLEAVFAHRAGGELTKRTPSDNALLIRALDLVLHGKAGAERSARPVGRAIDPPDVLHVHDDPAFVRAAVEKQDTSWIGRPDPRHVFLGGEAVLDWFFANLKKLKDHHQAMAEHFAPIRSERMLPLMTALSRTKQGKDAGQRWLATQEP